MSITLFFCLSLLRQPRVMGAAIQSWFLFFSLSLSLSLSVLQFLRFLLLRMDVYGCNDRKDRAVAASALSIVSILFAFVLLIFGVLMIMGCCSAAVVGPILTFFTAGCIAATFALIASIYLEKFCEPCQNVYFGAKVETDGDGRCLSFDGPPIAAKDVWKYAEGFILLVVAFVFEFLNLLEEGEEEEEEEEEELKHDFDILLTPPPQQQQQQESERRHPPHSSSSGGYGGCVTTKKNSFKYIYIYIY
eukprot:gene1180-696_t